MKASIVDLRYQMNDVLKALDRNEKVQVLYRGKVKGTIIPEHHAGQKKLVKDHAFFGMRRDKTAVEEVMHHLRQGRYHDL